MMWLARLKPVVAVAAALVLTTAGVAVQGRQQPAPEAAQERAKAAPPPAAGAGAAALAVPDLAANRAIAREQLALIDKAWAFQRALALNGRFDVGGASFFLWGRRRLEALRRAGAGKAEIVAALEQYVKDLKEDEAVAKDLNESGRATVLVVYDAQFRRMEAEIWLNEEKAR